MVTKLRGPLRREIRIGGAAHIVSISEDGLRLVEKGRRKGYELAWKDLVSGEAALAAALNASVRRAPPPRPPRTETSRTRRRLPASAHGRQAPRRAK